MNQHFYRKLGLAEITICICKIPNGIDSNIHTDKIGVIPDICRESGCCEYDYEISQNRQGYTGQKESNTIPYGFIGLLG